MFERRLVPVYLPRGVFGPLRFLKRLVAPSKASPSEPSPLIDLSGDREVEWSYIASRLPTGSGSVLDFGAGYGNMSVHAVQRGYQVLALDLEDNPFHWSHPNLKRVKGDLLKLDLPEKSFDYVLNCSTVEHVGLAGRYGVSVEENNGDLEAMRRLRDLLKPTGKMLMTVPCGRDAVVVPWHRVYGRKRFPDLLKGYEIAEQCYWAKQSDNCWHPADRESALSYVPTSHETVPRYCTYALACLVLSVTGD
jgi:SAM-dependent methyltransferase